MTRGMTLRKSGSVSSVYKRDKPPEPEPDPETAPETAQEPEEILDEKEEEDEEESKEQITNIDAMLAALELAPLSLETLKDCVITLTKQVNLLKLKVITNKRNYKKQINTLRKKIENNENDTKANIKSLSQNFNKQLHQQRNLIIQNIPDPKLPSPKIIHDEVAPQIVDNPEANANLARAQTMIEEALQKETNRLKQQVETENTQEKDTKKTPASTSASPPSSSRKRCEIPPPAELDTHRKNIDALLVGTSIIKHVRGGTVKRKCGKRAKVCSFPGASSEKVRKQTEIELEYYNPKIAIIHSGGNDLAEQKMGDEIVKEISSLAQQMYDTGVQHIGVSAVTPRVGLAYEIQDLNFRLKNMCAIQGLNFIEHKNILFRNHVCHDGVHLNYEGVNFLTNNFSNYLRSVGLEDEK